MLALTSRNGTSQRGVSLPCGCQLFGPSHATCAYSWISPSRPSRRTTLPGGARTTGTLGSSDGACPTRGAGGGRCRVGLGCGARLSTSPFPRTVWVPENRSWVLSCEFAEEAIGRDDQCMTLRLLYLLFRQVVSWLALLPRRSAGHCCIEPKDVGRSRVKWRLSSSGQRQEDLEPSNRSYDPPRLCPQLEALGPG
jgi:hypothetical protein